MLLLLQADDHPRQSRLPAPVARFLRVRPGEEAEGEGGGVAGGRGAAARGLRDPPQGEALPGLPRREARYVVVVVVGSVVVVVDSPVDSPVVVVVVVVVGSVVGVFFGSTE